MAGFVYKIEKESLSGMLAGGGEVLTGTNKRAKYLHSHSWSGRYLVAARMDTSYLSYCIHLLLRAAAGLNATAGLKRALAQRK